MKYMGKMRHEKRKENGDRPKSGLIFLEGRRGGRLLVKRFGASHAKNTRINQETLSRDFRQHGLQHHSVTRECRSVSLSVRQYVSVRHMGHRRVVAVRDQSLEPVTGKSWSSLLLSQHGLGSPPSTDLSCLPPCAFTAKGDYAESDPAFWQKCFSDDHSGWQFENFGAQRDVLLKYLFSPSGFLCTLMVISGGGLMSWSKREICV